MLSLVMRRKILITIITWQQFTSRNGWEVESPRGSKVTTEEVAVEVITPQAFTQLTSSDFD